MRFRPQTKPHRVQNCAELAVNGKVIGELELLPTEPGEIDDRKSSSVNGGLLLPDCVGDPSGYQRGQAARRLPRSRQVPPEFQFK